jgi:hypothetical protein
MPRPAGLFAILGIITLPACGGSDTVVAPPTRATGIAIVGGNGQSDTAGRMLAVPLAVVVRDNTGAPAANVQVEWTVTTGGGTLSASSLLSDGQGNASVKWTLGNTPGTQSVTATFTGIIGLPANFSATAIARRVVSLGPIILHYDGAGGSTALEDINAARVSLTSIWGATSSIVFAVGGACGNSLVLRYDGTGWGTPPPTCSGDSFSIFTSIWGNSASDVFVASRNGIPPKLGGSIDHYDGQNWTFMYFVPCPSGVLCPAFQGVWSSSSTDAFAVGDAGVIAHYDGTNWNQQTSGTTQALYGVWGVGSAGGVFVVGAAGTILSYDGSTWHAQTIGTSPLYAVWGTSASDVFAVGGAGTILHYDGTAWTAQSSGTTQSLYGIWGTSGNAVFAVGDGSTILHYDGAAWTAQTTAASMNLRGIWGSSATNVFAVGAPK